MKDQVLTIEQMNTLIDKGVDVSKASMCHEVGYSSESASGYHILKLNSNNEVIDIGFREIPTFTVADLMEMLPSGINDDTLEKCEVLEIYPCRIMGWTIMYRDRKQTSIRHSNKSLVTALFDTINSLLLCGHKLNNQT